MCEVGGVVALGFEVVEVVVASAAVQPQRHQAVRGPGQVVAAVVLHRQPHVDQEEHQLGERVAAQQGRSGSGEDAETKSLPSSGELCGEGRGGAEGVVHLENKREEIV